MYFCRPYNVVPIENIIKICYNTFIYANKLIRKEIVSELESNYEYLKDCVRYKEVIENDLENEIKTCEYKEEKELINDLKLDLVRVENTIDDLKLEIQACLELLLKY